jgi:hypothetical protein
VHKDSKTKISVLKDKNTPHADKYDNHRAYQSTGQPKSKDIKALEKLK